MKGMWKFALIQYWSELKSNKQINMHHQLFFCSYLLFQPINEIY